MKIQDLSKALDTKSMKTVRGGDNGTSTTNSVGQVMNLVAPVAALSGGPSNTSVHVNGTQNAGISNFQFSGDSFLALFPAELVRAI
jgi:hypothetical protein